MGGIWRRNWRSAAVRSGVRLWVYVGQDQHSFRASPAAQAKAMADARAFRDRARRQLYSCNQGLGLAADDVSLFVVTDVRTPGFLRQRQDRRLDISAVRKLAAQPVVSTMQAKLSPPS